MIYRVSKGRHKGSFTARCDECDKQVPAPKYAGDRTNESLFIYTLQQAGWHVLRRGDYVACLACVNKHKS